MSWLNTLELRQSTAWLPHTILWESLLGKRYWLESLRAALQPPHTDHHTAHWETADNQHFPECTVKHLCVSFSNIYMVRCHAHYYLCTGSCTWCDSVYSTLLYMILWEGAFIKGKSLADAFSKCSVDWCTWMSKLKHSTLGTCQDPQQYLSTQTGHWAVMGV